MTQPLRSVGFWTAVLTCFTSVFWAGCGELSNTTPYYGPTVTVADASVRPYVRFTPERTEFGFTLAPSANAADAAAKVDQVGEEQCIVECDSQMEHCPMAEVVEVCINQIEMANVKKDG